jgi:hypothetical protein
MQPPQHSEPECADMPLDLKSDAALARPRRKARRRSDRSNPQEGAPDSPENVRWWQAQAVRLSAMAAVWLGY